MFLQDPLQEIESTVDELDCKQLTRDREFLVHIVMTYRTVNPSLKGIHHFVDSWRPNQKGDSWKMKARAYVEFLATIQYDAVRERYINSHNIGHPPGVNYITRLVSDMKAIEKFFDKEEHTKVNMRAKNCHQVIYGVGDAFGEGFGDSFLTKDGLS